MKKILFLTIVILTLPLVCNATTTLTHTDGSAAYQLNTLDTDYDFSFPMWVGSVAFYPNAANEYIVLKYDTDSGEILVKLQSSDAEPRVMYFDTSFVKIFYDASESSVSSSSKIVITRNQ